MTIMRPNIMAGLLKRELSGPYILQIALGETALALKEALMKLSWARSFTIFSVCCKYHRQVFNGTADLASICPAVDLNRHVL
jgi:hypothetical protein